MKDPGFHICLDQRTSSSSQDEELPHSQGQPSPIQTICRNKAGRVEPVGSLNSGSPPGSGSPSWTSHLRVGAGVCILTHSPGGADTQLLRQKSCLRLEISGICPPGFRNLASLVGRMYLKKCKAVTFKPSEVHSTSSGTSTQGDLLE